MAKRKLTPKPSLFQRLKKYTPEFIIGLGVFALGLSIVHRQLYDRSLRLDTQAIAQYQQTPSIEDLKRQATPVHLKVGEVVDIDIEAGILRDNEWTISPTQATFWTDSGRPGIGGNIVIYGHNKRAIFGPLLMTKVGQNVDVTVQDGSVYQYVVTEIREVNPNQVEFIQPTDSETLTIYTCSGFLDSKRFIVRAVPV